jgi:glycosyltransferase 2 family protein
VNSKIVKIILQAVISLLLIIMLIHGADTPGLLARFQGVNPKNLFAAAMVMFSLSFLHAARWVAIIRANGGHMGFMTSLRLVLVGYFFSQALPSSVGGDAIRIWQAHRAGLTLGIALNTVVLDRLIALAALLVMTAAALPWLKDLVIDSTVRWTFMLALTAGVIGFAVLLILNRLPESLFRWKVVRAAAQLSDAARNTLLNAGYSSVSLALSVGVHIGVSLVVFILADALGVGVSLLNCILLVPLVTVVTLIPISIAGWGVRESAMVVAFGLIQVPRSDAIALSLLYGATILATGLPGGVLWWRTGHHVTPTDAHVLTQIKI